MCFTKTINLQLIYKFCIRFLLLSISVEYFTPVGCDLSMENKIKASPCDTCEQSM